MAEPKMVRAPSINRYGDDKGVGYQISRDPKSYDQYGENVMIGNVVTEVVEMPPRLDLPGAFCFFGKQVTKTTMKHGEVGIYEHTDADGITTYFRCSEPYT